MTNTNGSTEMMAKRAEIIVKAMFPIFLVKVGLYFRDFCEV